MTSERFQILQQNGGVIDLSDRAKFRLTGGDRVRYLNGQVTNDVRKAKADESVFACVTNLKGRIEGDVFIHTGSDGESLFLDAEPGLREALAMRLERYIIADDVELADVTDEWRLFHFFGAAAEMERLSAITTKGRLGGTGLDVWFRASVPMPAFDCAVVTADEAETLRICNGVPKWPLELNSEAFPAEAGLQNQAMDYAKGCYIGQEILSRIKTTGKMPRVLVRWLGGPEKPESTALFLRNKEGDEKEIGMITSSCFHPVLDRWVGLAYVRQGTEVMDSVLLADKVTPRMFSELEIIHS